MSPLAHAPEFAVAPTTPDWRRLSGFAAAAGKMLGYRGRVTDTGQRRRRPSITVVVATLGERPDMLAQALRGIASQDHQGALDCIVVLDRVAGSDIREVEGALGERRQAIAAIVEAGQHQLIDNERTRGLAGSRNTGIMAAKGDLVAFCDDDDCWLPGKLEAQIAALDAAPEAALVCCGIVVEYGETVMERVHPERVVTFPQLLRSRLMELHPSTFVARRAALMDGIGLVSEDFPGSWSEDYELLLRAARRGPIVNVPMPLVRVRWHPNLQAMSDSWPVMMRALPILLDRYPEFRTVPPGYARVAGQIAFAAAASGHRRVALRWAWRALVANPREPRTYLALAVASGAVGADRVSRRLRRRGRGL